MRILASCLMTTCGALASLSALAQAEPDAGIYAVRTPVDTAVSVPYVGLLTPGDGQNIVEVQPFGNPPLPAHGTVAAPLVYDGTPGQAFVYTPDAGYAGLDQFYYRITDGTGDYAVGLISVNVGNVPAVVADDDLVVGDAVAAPSPGTFLDVLFNDTGFADPVAFTVVQQPAHGTLAVTLPDPLWQSGILVFYTANPGFTGQDQFRYQLGDGVDQGTATVRLTISSDVDLDTILDALDNCPATSNPTQQDSDGDGRGDACDNCTLVANANQLDADNDGYGNICDADLNNSGRVTSADYTLLRSVLNRAANYSALAAASDLNGSGLVTSIDFTIMRARFNTVPGPSGLHP